MQEFAACLTHFCSSVKPLMRALIVNFIFGSAYSIEECSIYNDINWKANSMILLSVNLSAFPSHF